MASKKKGNAPKNEAEELLRLKELERLRIEKENELKAEAVSFFIFKGTTLARFWKKSLWFLGRTPMLTNGANNRF